MAKTDEIQDSLGELLSAGVPDGNYLMTTSARIVSPSKNPSSRVPMLNGEQRMAHWLTITYTISDPESDLFGVDDVRDMFELFPDIKDTDLMTLDPDERLAIRQQVKNRVQRFRQLGVPEDKINRFSEKDLSELMVEVTVKNSVSKKDKVTKYPNVVRVSRAEAVDETDYDI